MRSFLAPKALTAVASLAALAALSACSDTTAPTRGPGSYAAFAVGVATNIGPVQTTFASNGSTQYCAAASATLFHVYTAPGTLNAIAGCGTATDLTTDINAYNPGWSQPIAGSSWIGPMAKSQEYRTAPGGYVFQTTFHVDAGVTNPVLNDTIRSDNAVAVYLNGHQLAVQTIADCAESPGGDCNWITGHEYIVSDATASDFIIGGDNTLTTLLIDTPIGYGQGGSAPDYLCSNGPQMNGRLGYTSTLEPTSNGHVVANWSSHITATGGCENPGGVTFHGGVSWVVPAVLQWCSPGFWKNHLNAWSTADQNLPYSSLGAGRAPLSKKAPTSGPGSNPTLLDVLQSPNVYGGPATNSVADYLSGKAFGSSVGTSADDARCNDGVLLGSRT